MIAYVSHDNVMDEKKSFNRKSPGFGQSGARSTHRATPKPESGDVCAYDVPQLSAKKSFSRASAGFGTTAALSHARKTPVFF